MIDPDVLEFDVELGFEAGQAGGGLEILPGFSSLSGDPYSFQFSLAWTAPAGNRLTVSLSPVGAAGPFLEPGSDAGLAVRSQIDYFAATGELADPRLKIQVSAADLSAVADTPCLLSVCVRPTGGATVLPDVTRESRTKIDIPVPPISQMVDADLGPRLCSPTSVTMVICHYGFPAQLRQVADMAYHPAHDRYGVWPAALYAASRHHLLGYLMWFSDWEAARWLLEHGVPIVASIRYKEGELDGAPIASTAGHLVVVRGYDADSVWVNDPAADQAEQVTRSYSFTQFLKAWLQGSGVGYVLFPGTH